MSRLVNGLILGGLAGITAECYMCARLAREMAASSDLMIAAAVGVSSPSRRMAWSRSGQGVERAAAVVNDARVLPFLGLEWLYCDQRLAMGSFAVIAEIVEVSFTAAFSSRR